MMAFMGFYRDYLLPRIVERTLSSEEVQDLRRRCLAGLRGTVLEVGFGSGLNLPFYPAEVDRILAVEPSTGAKHLARERLEAAMIPVRFIGSKGEDIPLHERSVDGAVTTWTLCTVPDVQQALSEIRRVLKPGGCLHFMEHGRADDPSVARWQDRLNPFQKLVAGGCHLNRRIDDIIREGGLDIRLLENFYMKGPRIGTFLYSGVAVKNGT